MKQTHFALYVVVALFAACTREPARQRPASRADRPAPGTSANNTATPTPTPTPEPPTGPNNGPPPTLPVPSTDVPRAALAEMATDAQAPLEVVPGVRIGAVSLGATREELHSLGLRFPNGGTGNSVRSPPYEITFNAEGRVDAVNVRVFECPLGLNILGHRIVRAASVDDVAQEFACGMPGRRFGGDFAQCLDGRLIARSPSIAPDAMLVEIRARPLGENEGLEPDAGIPVGGVRAILVGNTPPPNCPFLVGDWCFNSPTNACAYAGCPERCQVIEARPSRVVCPGRPR